jgi:hypothetical protein
MGATRDDLTSGSTNDGTPPYLDLWAAELERGRWPGWICDSELRLGYVSTELKRFMSDSLGREIDDEAAGVGQNVFDALMNEAWRATMSADSLARLMPRALGYLKAEFGLSPTALADLLPEPFRAFVEAAPDAVSTGVLSERFE